MYKRVKGRKRHIVVDTQGFVLKVSVTSASVQDRQMLLPLLREVHARCPRLSKVWVDAAYEGLEKTVQQELGLDLEVAQRPDKAKGFQVLARRWVVERTFAWGGRYRRLSKDYEYDARTSEAMFYLAMTSLMSRRLARLRASPTF
jgi:putative transposase